MRLAAALLLSAALIAAPAAAQPYEDADALEASMAAAQLQSARPGDEALTCEQLQAELGATMTDPSVQAVIAANGAMAQQQLDAAQAARNRAVAQAGVGMALGLASSFIPGLGYAQQAAQMAQMGDAQRQAGEAMAQRQQMLASMESIMPQIMRGERLVELAQAQQCPFLQGQGMDEAPGG